MGSDTRRHSLTTVLRIYIYIHTQWNGGFGIYIPCRLLCTQTTLLTIHPVCSTVVAINQSYRRTYQVPYMYVLLWKLKNVHGTGLQQKWMVVVICDLFRVIIYISIYSYIYAYIILNKDILTERPRYCTEERRVHILL